VVRAVRVNGKPRHKFVVGLGSLKEGDNQRRADCFFWIAAFMRLRRHGLDTHHFADELTRKGVQPPTLTEMQDARSRGWSADIIDDIIAWLEKAVRICIGLKA
jgi:hypothetical protein